MRAWTTTGYELCINTTGHSKTWPDWANKACPVCKREFFLGDFLAVLNGVVYHEDCYKTLSQRPRRR